MNYYEHHIGDYDSATAHLSLTEDGVYRRLICLYYRTEQPLPADTKAVCRLVRAASKQERDTVADVLGEFFQLAQDGWHNERCDQEIARFQDKQAKAKRSAEARWSAQRSQSEGNANAYANASTRTDANASADAMRTHSEGNAPRARPQTPDTNHQTPEERRGRATALPPTWTLPDEWAEWCRQTRPDLDPKLTAERFRDFWVAKPGKDGRKLDWLATWRNWVRNERPGPRASLAQAEPAWRTEQRNRIREAAPYAVTQPPTFDEESWSQPHELPAP